MKNVEISQKGSIVTITVDTAKSYGPSASGKTTIIASTEGNQRLADGSFLGLNVYKKAAA